MNVTIEYINSVIAIVIPLIFGVAFVYLIKDSIIDWIIKYIPFDKKYKTFKLAGINFKKEYTFTDYVRYLFLEKIVEYVKGKIISYTKLVRDFYNKRNDEAFVFINNILSYCYENRLVLFVVIIIAVFNAGFIWFFNSLTPEDEEKLNWIAGTHIEIWGVIIEIIILVLVLGHAQKQRIKEQRIQDTKTKLWEELKRNTKENEQILFLIRRLNNEGSKPSKLDDLEFHSKKYDLKTNYDIKDLSHVEFFGCSFKGVSFANVKLENVIFSSCYFDNCSFNGCNLSNAIFDGCNMEFSDPNEEHDFLSFLDKDKTYEPLGSIDFNAAEFRYCIISNFFVDNSQNFETVKFVNTYVDENYKFPEGDLSDFKERNQDDFKISYNINSLSVGLQIMAVYQTLRGKVFVVIDDEEIELDSKVFEQVKDEKEKFEELLNNIILERYSEEEEEVDEYFAPPTDKSDDVFESIFGTSQDIPNKGDQIEEKIKKLFTDNELSTENVKDIRKELENNYMRGLSAEQKSNIRLSIMTELKEKGKTHKEAKEIAHNIVDTIIELASDYYKK